MRRGLVSYCEHCMEHRGASAWKGVGTVRTGQVWAILAGRCLSRGYCEKIHMLAGGQFRASVLPASWRLRERVLMLRGPDVSLNVGVGTKTT